MRNGFLKSQWIDTVGVPMRRVMSISECVCPSPCVNQSSRAECAMSKNSGK